MTDGKTTAAGAADAAPAAEESYDDVWDAMAAEHDGAPGPEPTRTDDVPAAPGPDADAAPAASTPSQDAPTVPADAVPSAPEPPVSPDATTPPESTPKATQQENEDLKKQLANMQARSAGQARRITSLMKERERLIQAGDASSQPDQASQDALATAQKEYGDILDPVINQVTRLQDQMKSMQTDTKARVADIDAELQATANAEVQKVMAHHPDFYDYLKEHRPVFERWIDDQPRVLRDAFEVNRASMVDGESAALVMTRFKQDMQAAAQAVNSGPAPQSQPTDQARRARQLQGAQSSTVHTPQAATGMPDPEDYDANWDYYVKQEQKRTG